MDDMKVNRRGILGGLAALGIAPKVVGDAVAKTSLKKGLKAGAAVATGIDESPLNEKVTFGGLLKDFANESYVDHINLPTIWNEEFNKFEKVNPDCYYGVDESYKIISRQYKSFGEGYKMHLAEKMSKNTNYEVWFSKASEQVWPGVLRIWENRLDEIPITKMTDRAVMEALINSYRYLRRMDKDNGSSGLSRYLSSVRTGTGTFSPLTYLRENKEQFPNIMRIDEMFNQFTGTFI